MKQNKIPRNEYIIKPKGKTNPYKDDVQYGKSGQLRYPYQVTKIPGDTMSTEGYGNIPLWTVPDVGPPRMVYPNTGNQFFAGANNFTEYPMKSPMARYGGSSDMYPFGGIHTKTDTHMATGGWLDSYEPGGEKPWGDMTTKERAAYLDAKEANAKAETTSRKQATKEHYQDYVKDSMKKTLEHPMFNTAQYFTPEGMAIGAIKGLANVGPDVARGDYSAAAFDALTALPAVAPAIKNAYRVNPWAEKLNNPKSSYRVAGLDAGEDFKKTGVLRSNNTTPAQLVEGTNFMLPPRPTGFPSFQKGYADLNYLPDEGGVIFKTDLPTFKRGELNPVTGFPIKGRHYAHRVIDPKTGATVTNIPGADVKMYGSEPHWLKGYKEVPVELPGSPNGLQNTYIHPTGKMEGIGDIKDIKRSLMREDQYLKPSEYNSKAIPFSSYKPQAGGYTDVPEFNQELNNMLTKLQYGKRPTLTKENFYNKEELNKLTKQYKDYHAALNEYEKANPQSGASMMMGMFSNENPYMNTFHNLNPNLKEPNWGEKFWGHLDDTKELNTYLPNAPGVRTPLSPDALKYMGSSENKLVPTAKNLVDNPNEWFHKTNKKDYVNEMRGSLNLKLSDIQNMSEKELETTAQKIFNKIENQKKERYLKDVSTPYTGLDAYQNLQPNKYGGFNKKEGGWLDEYQTGGKIDMSKVKMNYFPKSNVEAQSRLDEEKAWENDYYRQQDKDYKNEVNAAVKKGIPRKQAELVIKKYKTEPQEQSTVVAHTPQSKMSKALEVATNPVLAMKNYKGHRLPDNFSSNAEEDFFSPTNVSNMGYQFLTGLGNAAFTTSSGEEAVQNIKDKDYLMAGINAAFSIPAFSYAKKAANKLLNPEVFNLKNVNKFKTGLSSEKQALNNFQTQHLDVPPPPSYEQYAASNLDPVSQRVWQQQPIIDDFIITPETRGLMNFTDPVDIARDAWHNNDRFLTYAETHLLDREGLGNIEDYLRPNAPINTGYTVPDINSPYLWSNFETLPAKPVNRSGLTKEEALERFAGTDKEAISKMSEKDFKESVMKPTGEIVPYKLGPEVNQMGYNTDLRNMQLKDAIPMSNEEYSSAFNERLDLLNDIIAKNNKSGVEYKVKGLDESGRLSFYTPPGQYATNTKNKNITESANSDIRDFFKNQLLIPEGESSWSTKINPGQWRGEVEDIANSEYYKSIPGLDMRNTSSGVFADNIPRKGTGTYESINEYLKGLDLGRVKPGFNSQTNSSKGLWENNIKKGKAFGFYNDKNTVYGAMKSALPYVGTGALGAAALQQEKNGGWLDEYQSRGEVKPYEATSQKDYDYRKQMYNDSLALYNLGNDLYKKTRSWWESWDSPNQDPRIANSRKEEILSNDEIKKRMLEEKKLIDKSSKGNINNNIKPISGKIVSYEIPTKELVRNNGKVIKKDGKPLTKEVFQTVKTYLPIYQKPVQLVNYKKTEEKQSIPESFIKKQWNFNNPNPTLEYYDKTHKLIKEEAYNNTGPNKKLIAPIVTKQKYGGLLDEEFRRGGQKGLKKYTSKNIQSSVNDIMLRNETLFGPAGKKRYKPNLKYKDGGWLDNMY